MGLSRRRRQLVELRRLGLRRRVVSSRRVSSRLEGPRCRRALRGRLNSLAGEVMEDMARLTVDSVGMGMVERSRVDGELASRDG